MKDLFKKLSLMASIVALIMSAFTFTACGGDDDAPDGGGKSDKGNVFTFEVYLDGDTDKFGIDGMVEAYDKGNGHGVFKTTGGVVLDSYKNDGFGDWQDGGIAGYSRVFGNGLGAYGKDYPTTSKHFSISSEEGCEKMKLTISLYSNKMLSSSDILPLDENAELSIRIIGYVNGVKTKDNTAVYKYNHTGGIHVFVMFSVKPSS